MGRHHSLKDQRRALMEGKWVQHPPNAEDEACLIAAGHYKTGCTLDVVSLDYLRQAIYHLHHHWPHSPGTWNDLTAQSFDQVLEVLDYAIKLEEADGAA